MVTLTLGQLQQLAQRLVALKEMNGIHDTRTV
jgi:hypothetical protein